MHENVDNAEVIRSVLRVLLNGSEHEVVTEAGSGRQALDLYAKYRPDIVTMDIRMRDQAGHGPPSAMVLGMGR